MHPNPRIAELLNTLNHPALPGIDLSLARMEKLLAALGNPHLKLPPVIHIAGTNGKGSTLAFLRAIYGAAGYRVHAYSSPHLVRFNERITLGGVEITDELLLPILERVVEAVRHIPATFFEATTAAAFLAFAEYPAELVLLETGLGGRLDATSMVPNPVLTIITPIDFDHMEFLGPTLAAIAAEKAGIIKPGVLCVVGAQGADAHVAIARAAYARRAPLLACGFGWNAGVEEGVMKLMWDTGTLELPHPSLPGAHQLHNAALAAIAVKHCDVLPVPDAAITQGLRTARWPGRLQRLQHGPLVEAWGARGAVMLDGAHNVSGARALAEWAAGQNMPITLVCGMMERKDAAGFFVPLAPHVRQLYTAPITGEACYGPQALADAARAARIEAVAACASLDEAAGKLAGEEAGTLLIAGSLFLAGEVLKNHG